MAERRRLLLESGWWQPIAPGVKDSWRCLATPRSWFYSTAAAYRVLVGMRPLIPVRSEDGSE
jgi:hypothetical protein